MEVTEDLGERGTTKQAAHLYRVAESFGEFGRGEQFDQDATVQESSNVRQGLEFTYFRANSAWWPNSGLPSSPWRLRLDTLAQIAVEAIYAFFSVCSVVAHVARR